MSWHHLSSTLSPGCTEHFFPNAPLVNFELLPPPPLELRGGQIAERRVPPMRVVKALDVVEERQPGGRPRRKCGAQQ